MNIKGIIRSLIEEKLSEATEVELDESASGFVEFANILMLMKNSGQISSLNAALIYAAVTILPLGVFLGIISGKFKEWTSNLKLLIKSRNMSKEQIKKFNEELENIKKSLTPGKKGYLTYIQNKLEKIENLDTSKGKSEAQKIIDKVKSEYKMNEELFCEASIDEDKSAEYEKVRALMPSSMPANEWIPIKNGFEAIVSSKGSYTLRRKVKMAGELRYEKFSLTRSGGLKSLGFSRIEESLDEASDSKIDKAMAIINTRITKQGQPPKYPSFDSAPEDIKAAARNLAKNLK